MCHLFLLCWPWLFKYFTCNLCKFTLPARNSNLLSILFARHLIRHLSGDCLRGLFNFFWPFNYLVNSAKRNKFVPKLAPGLDSFLAGIIAHFCSWLPAAIWDPGGGFLFQLVACVRIAACTVRSVIRLGYTGNRLRCDTEFKDAVASKNFD